MSMNEPLELPQVKPDESSNLDFGTVSASSADANLGAEEDSSALEYGLDDGSHAELAIEVPERAGAPLAHGTDLNNASSTSTSHVAAITFSSEAGMGVLDVESAEVAALVDPSNETTDTAPDSNVRIALLDDALDGPPPTEATSTIQSTTSRVVFRSHSTFTPPGCSDGSNFCRDAQWCADGGSVLTVLEDASIMVLDV